MLESQLRKQPDASYQYTDRYFFTLYKLQQLVRDFQGDCHDGFIGNDKTYIEEWCKNTIK